MFPQFRPVVATCQPAGCLVRHATVDTLPLTHSHAVQMKMAPTAVTNRRKASCAGISRIETVSRRVHGQPRP